ncbi:MAG: hypothetical protein ACU0DT_19950, partial [Albimonas sp.]|uniref:hypothetical protein n=1 Tax=Albimonas sp. TaxID=1872425 RepID=UPI004057794D
SALHEEGEEGGGPAAAPPPLLRRASSIPVRGSKADILAAAAAARSRRSGMYSSPEADDRFEELPPRSGSVSRRSSSAARSPVRVMRNMSTTLVKDK